ncbi:MAG: HAMP domain-containing sensor histidine kinase, partial [Pseudomonadota bacterium]
MLRNSRTRLIAASVVLNVCVAAILLTILYASVNSIISTETRSVVEAELAGLSDDYQRLGVLGLASAIERRIETSDKRDAIYLLADRRGRAIAGNLAAWPPNIEPGGGWVDLELIRTDTEQPVPVSAASLRLQGGERLLVGRDASALRQFDNALYRSVIWALFGGLLLSLVTSWLLTKLVFSRIQEISGTARSIMSGDLDRRIPVRGTGDEFDQLSATLNEMLDRINALIGNLKFATTSLSHDLRSPLTRLRSRLESLADDAEEAGQQNHALARSLEDVDMLLKIFSNLTEIAHAETRLSREDFSQIDLMGLVNDAVELYGPVAQESSV